MPKIEKRSFYCKVHGVKAKNAKQIIEKQSFAIIAETLVILNRNPG
jgi:hypothetical protein